VTTSTPASLPSASHADIAASCKAGQSHTRRATDPPCLQTFVNCPDWVLSARTFHSASFNTATFASSPIRTPSGPNSTSGHWPQPAGHSRILRFSIVLPPCSSVILLARLPEAGALNDGTDRRVGRSGAAPTVDQRPKI